MENVEFRPLREIIKEVYPFTDDMEDKNYYNKQVYRLEGFIAPFFKGSTETDDRIINVSIYRENELYIPTGTSRLIELFVEEFTNNKKFSSLKQIVNTDYVRIAYFLMDVDDVLFEDMPSEIATDIFCRILHRFTYAAVSSICVPLCKKLEESSPYQGEVIGGKVWGLTEFYVKNIIKTLATFNEYEWKVSDW